jgi:hypothetical protein
MDPHQGFALDPLKASRQPSDVLPFNEPPSQNPGSASVISPCIHIRQVPLQYSQSKNHHFVVVEGLHFICHFLFVYVFPLTLNSEFYIDAFQGDFESGFPL